LRPQGEALELARSVRKLTAHWRASLPGAIHDLSYERLVSDQLGEIRRLDTPPVRQSLYDSSLTQWRHYATQLEGLRHQLVTADIEVDS